MHINSSYSTKEIAKIIDGKYIGNVNFIVSSVCYDSRLIFNDTNGLFLAIKTKKNDGHKYILDAYNKGIRSFIVEKLPKIVENDATYILVKDSIISLQKWAKHHRDRFNIPVLAISGSYGKTIVKEWIFHLTKSTYNVLRSPKSFNSKIGVALSVLMLSKHHELGVFELGISKPDEMVVLKKITKPTHVIITNVANAHLENFESKTELIKEKEKLLLEENNVYYKNGKLPLYEQKTTETGQEIILNKGGKKRIFTIPFKNEISALNFIHCIAFLDLIKIKEDTIKNLCPSLPKISSRLEKKEGIFNSTLINDTYSHDHSSIYHGLEMLKAESGKGNSTLIYVNDKKLNKDESDEIMNWINKFEISQFIIIGSKLKHLQSQLRQNDIYFKSLNAFNIGFEKLNLFNHHILLKGNNKSITQKINEKIEAKKHETALEINLNHIENNYTFYKKLISNETKILAMIKAAGYGAGLIEIGKKLEFCNVDYLGVAYVDEGVDLRNNGIEKPILVMNPGTNSFTSLINNNLTPAIHDINQLNSFTGKLIDLNINAYPVHLKLNSGMNRLGFSSKEIDSLITFLMSQPEIKVEGIFSHLFASDDKNAENQTLNQINNFKIDCEKIEDSLKINTIKHILNTSGIEHYRDHQFNMVRLGIGLYGISSKFDLKPVASLTSIVSKIRVIDPDEFIGYGLTSLTKKKTKIAIIPVGYADGYSRILGNGKGKMMINNQLASTIGNICMDMTFLDITDLKIKEGDKVEIFGMNRKIQDLAEEADTIPYEILSQISQRVVRVYEKD